MPSPSDLGDLIFGRGRYLREGAPEPTLLSPLLEAVSSEAFVRAAVSSDIAHLTASHPSLRADLFSTIAGRFAELPVTHQSELRGREPFSLWTLLTEAYHAEGAKRRTLIEQLLRTRGFGAHADVVVGADLVLSPSDPSAIIERWLNEAPSFERSLGPEWTCWAYSMVAQRVPAKRFSGTMDTAFAAAKQLDPPWQRAEAVRQLLGALMRAGVPESVRASALSLLNGLVPADDPWRSHLLNYIGFWTSEPQPNLQSTAQKYLPPAQVFVSELRRLLDEPSIPEAHLDAFWIQAPAFQATAIPILGAGEYAPPPPPHRERTVPQAVEEGMGAVFARWSGRSTGAHAAPPPPPAPAPPTSRSPAPAGRAAAGVDDEDDFALGARRGARAPVAGNGGGGGGQPSPPPRDRVVNTNITDRDHPDDSPDHTEPLQRGALYYYWVQIGAPIPGALAPSVLPADLPASAELDVALFAPDGGFKVDSAASLGRLKLVGDGTAEVLQQPGKSYKGVNDETLKRRLLFPLRAPSTAGRYRLRSNIYCQGVLVESRLIEASVGQAAPAGTTPVAAQVDYVLSHAFAARTFGGMQSHQLSVLLNRNADGNHDFYFHSSASDKKINRAVTIGGNGLNDAIREERRGLRRVTWGDEQEYNPENPQTDRYKTTPIPLNDLRTDLAILAARGCKIYNAVVPKLADDEEALKTLLKAPGVLQIAEIEDIGFVLPAAIVYDYPFRSQLREFNKFDLCPVFAEAFKEKPPLLETRCFQGACPSRGTRTTVCPSGFWGFRHAIGIPMSVGKDVNAELEPRIRYHGVPGIVVAVSTDPGLPARQGHQQDIQKLRNEWVANQGWALGDTTQKVLDLLAQKNPHLVYFYCHGGISESGGARDPYLNVGPLNDEPLVPETVGEEVHWSDPHPLVFINGCHTTALDADTVLGFVTTLIERSKACGVIGTEITVFEPLAGAFAKRFWELFLGGTLNIGEAIQQARLDLLLAGNPLGLVYTPFVFAGTKLEKLN